MVGRPSAETRWLVIASLFSGRETQPYFLANVAENLQLDIYHRLCVQGIGNSKIHLIG